MTNSEQLKDLVFNGRPVFTPSRITSIAELCGISYQKTLSFLSYHQNKGENVHDSLCRLISFYRPDLVEQQTAA